MSLGIFIYWWKNVFSQPLPCKKIALKFVIYYEIVVNSEVSYLASKCFNLTSKNRLKSRTCLSVSLSVQYVMQSHNLIDFGHFYHFFCKFHTRHIKKEWEPVKLFWPPLQLLRSISNCVIFQCRNQMFWGISLQYSISCAQNLVICRSISPIRKILFKLKHVKKNTHLQQQQKYNLLESTLIKFEEGLNLQQ